LAAQVQLVQLVSKVQLDLKVNKDSPDHKEQLAPKQQHSCFIAQVH
jgi:hypothetical protein